MAPNYFHILQRILCTAPYKRDNNERATISCDKWYKMRLAGWSLIIIATSIFEKLFTPFREYVKSDLPLYVYHLASSINTFSSILFMVLPCLNGKKLVRFRNKIGEIDDYLLSNFPFAGKESVGVNFSLRLQFVVVAFQQVVTIFARYMYSYETLVKLNQLAQYSITVMILFTAVFDYSNSVYYLRRRFLRLNEICTMAKTRHQRVDRKLWAVYFMLLDLVGVLNKAYGIQNLIIMSQMGAWSLYNTYFLWNNVIKNPGGDLLNGIVEFSIWETNILLTSCVLIFQCPRCVDAAKELKKNLLWPESGLANAAPPINVMLASLNKTVGFTACSWFEIDYRFLLSMLGLTITYVSFLVSFS